MCSFRIGYLAASKSLMQILIRCHQKMVLCATSFAQDAALAALGKESDEMNRMLDAFDQRRKVIYDTLTELKIPLQQTAGGVLCISQRQRLGMDGDQFALRF